MRLCGSEYVIVIGNKYSITDWCISITSVGVCISIILVDSYSMSTACLLKAVVQVRTYVRGQARIRL